ncbi:MAG: porin [Alphaproteobacteria bacterium]|nr:porin [Alphaproteobacteria bacterium]
MRFQSLWQMPLLLGVAATSFTYAAAPAAVAPVAPVVAAPAAPVAARPVDTATLMKQIEDLKKQVSTIAQKQRKADEKLDATTKVEDAKIGVLQANQVSPYPAGFIAIPGSNSAIKIGGRVRMDGVYNPGNAGSTSGGNMSARSLPIKGADQKAGRSGHFNGTAQGSQLEINSLSKTNKGDIKAKIQFDFFGANSTAGGGSSSTSTHYGLRLRQAFAEWNNLIAGQTETNFQDTDLMPQPLDNVGGLATVQRRPQVRWTQKVGDGLKLSVSAERGNTDYTNQALAAADNATYGKSSLPDLTARLRYEGKMGFVSLAGIYRQLQVNVAITDSIPTFATTANATAAAGSSMVNYGSKVSAWGINLAGKLITKGKSNVYSRITVGDGLGYLVEDATNCSAYLQVPTSTGNAIRYAPRFDTATVTNGVIGYAHWWTDAFRTNIGGSYTKIKHSPFIPKLTGATQANARVKKAVVNAIYSPVKDIDIGLELMYAVRETVSGVDKTTDTGTSTYYAGGTGKATQIMTSFIYKF